MNPFRAVVFTNGFDELPCPLPGFPAEDTLLVAVDGGANLLHAAGLTPRVVIGDMDSVLPGVLESLVSRCEILRYPPAKDETDSELALDWCAQQGIREVMIVNPLNGRFDQTLAVVFLLEYAAELGMNARIFNGHEELCIPAQEFRSDARPGTLISLLPLSPVVAGVRTEGLLYPLRGETLYRSRTRGISNRVVEGPYVVTHNDGQMLLITGAIS